MSREIREIRVLHPYRYGSICSEYGVQRESDSRIRNAKSWNHVHVVGWYQISLGKGSQGHGKGPKGTEETSVKLAQGEGEDELMDGYENADALH